jgi:hypothetical protein
MIRVEYSADILAISEGTAVERCLEMLLNLRAADVCMD